MRKIKRIVVELCRQSGIICYRSATMTDERVVDEIVTNFLFNTCRLCPRLSTYTVQAAVVCAVVASKSGDIPTVTGSVAEFYIEPMLPHVGDVDVMYHPNDVLVIPQGHPPPTQLPAEFHNYVQVFEIIDSHLPAYVYLQLRYLLTKHSDSDRYNVTEYEKQGKGLRTTNELRKYKLHGPACMHSRESVGCLSSDLVPCVRCLSWPLQATGWPSRHRNFSWPDSATIDRVINNGCDVVQIAHRECKQDELISTFQWRLSFSRAEITLINSWMPVQQTVYHLLRVFLKTERITENASNSGVCTLSNYHIKTLMLWACELNPKSWWTDDLSLNRICVELLHTLAVWLTETRCPHYFVGSCNLVDKSIVLEMIASRLLLVDKNCLSSWFVNYYLRQTAQICAESVSRLFDDISTDAKLTNAVSAVVECRLNTMLVDSWHAFQLLEFETASCSSCFSVTARVCVCWMNELAKVDWRLTFFFAAVVFLHIAHKIERGGLIENLIEMLSISEFFISSNNYNEPTLSLLHKVVTVASKYQLTAINSANCNTFQLVELLQQSAVELLKTFRHFEAQDFGSIATIVTTDFEMTYAYKRGDYPRCLQLSTRNVLTLLNACRTPSIPIFPEFITLLDDDIVSLTALTRIVNPELLPDSRYNSITQLTLSLYLMTQCQLKLRHSLTSLAQTLDYIEVAQKRHNVPWTLNHLTLKLAERKTVKHVLQLETVCRRSVQ